MCTGVQIRSKNGQEYWGRTQEFDAFLPVEGIIVPAGTSIDYLQTQFQSKYAVLGLSFDGSQAGVDLIEIADGVNEFGLAGGSFAFNENYFRPADEEAILAAGKMPLRGEEFVTWALMNATSCQDLKEKALKEVAISKTPNMLGQVIGQHYVFADKTGDSIVIEPSVAGSFDIYQNNVRTFTNQPAFPWHVQNLQNYVNISDQIADGRTFSQENIWSPGKGSGLLGIPGDFTPQSRFVRAAAFNALAEAPTEEEAMGAVFHLLNNFDIPKGVVRSHHPLIEEELVQYTQYTSAYDLEHLVMQVSTYGNRQIQELRLDTANIGQTVQRFTVEHRQQVATMQAK